MWWQNDTLTVEVNTNRVHTDFKLETLCQLGPIKMSTQIRKFFSKTKKNLIKLSHKYEEKQDKSNNSIKDDSQKIVRVHLHPLIIYVSLPLFSIFLLQKKIGWTANYSEIH